MTVEEPTLDETVVADVEAFAAARIKEAQAHPRKANPLRDLDTIKQELLESLAEKYGEELFETRAGGNRRSIRRPEKAHHAQSRHRDQRPHGRTPARRDPAYHHRSGRVAAGPWSALFTRGETQALVATTLGTSRDEMRMDELTGDSFRRFFPALQLPRHGPVGEVRRITGPGRREVGHGETGRARPCRLLALHRRWRKMKPMWNPDRKTSPTPSALSPRLPKATVPVRWPPYAAAR